MSLYLSPLPFFVTNSFQRVSAINNKRKQIIQINADKTLRGLWVWLRLLSHNCRLSPVVKPSGGIRIRSYCLVCSEEQDSSVCCLLPYSVLLSRSAVKFCTVFWAKRWSAVFHLRLPPPEEMDVEEVRPESPGLSRESLKRDQSKATLVNVNIEPGPSVAK